MAGGEKGKTMEFRVVKVQIFANNEDFSSLEEMEREVGCRLNEEGGGSVRLIAVVRPFQVTRSLKVPAYWPDVEVAYRVQQWLDTAQKPQFVERL